MVLNVNTKGEFWILRACYVIQILFVTEIQSLLEIEAISLKDPQVQHKS